MFAAIHTMSRHDKLRSLSIVFICLLVAGCGDGKDLLKTYPTRGKASFQGKPMQYALITFHPIDGEAKARHLLPRGTVGEDGNYTLGTYRVGDGAIPGKYKVTIVWSNNPDSEMISPNRPISFKGVMSMPIHQRSK